VRGSPDFAKLPKDTQQYVANTLKEMTEYQGYAGQVHEIGNLFTHDLASIKSEDLLTQVRTELEKTKPPPAYEGDWSRTQAVSDWKKWSKDLSALDAAVKKTRDAYERFSQDAAQLVDYEKKEDPRFFTLRKTLRAQLNALPQPVRDKAKLIPGADYATYGQVFEMPAVREAYRAWENSPARKLIGG
jgi:hypothetical protein